MAVANQPAKAVHLEGGNHFDDVRIDISASHDGFADLPRNPKSIKQARYRNYVKLFLTRVLIRFGLQEFLIVNGIKKKWLDDFGSYWSEILDGRPFWNTLDFFLLLHTYRNRQQQTYELEWNGPEQHLVNWQHPAQIYGTLHAVRILATYPTVNLHPFRQMKQGSRILEYGCSLAPYYNCYREYFSHMDCRWVLGDIPNFPFHYAKFRYRNDAGVEFTTINAADFSNPLGEAGNFDVIILTTVLEHLDDPLFISEYLLNRLSPGGLFVFDYIKSEGQGLDHPYALETRENCIKSILDKVELIYGNVSDITRSIGLCIGRK